MRRKCSRQMSPETVKALEELARAAAKHAGMDENNFTFAVCHRNSRSVIICPRCSEKTNAFIMSKFNTDQICIPCKEREEKHPKYAEADKAETDAVRAGNYNFPGIGCPTELYMRSASM